MDDENNGLWHFNGVPTWVLSGASADLDFADGYYYTSTAGYTPDPTTLITTSRASSGYTLNTDGSYSLFGSNVPRITGNGILIEQAATNLALQSRDMTQSVWVKSGISASLTAVGIDNVANSASQLTGTSANGTVLQSLTVTSQAQTYSLFLQRVSGSGEIDITQNGGSTWIPTVLTSAWSRFNITTTLANPQIGVRIVASGDVINADFSQNEVGSFPTSPILTTTAAGTRAADVVAFTGSAVTAALMSKASFLQTFLCSGNASSFERIVDYNNVSQLGFGSITQIVAGTTAGVNNVSAILGSGSYAGLVKGAYGFDGSNITVIANGGSKTTTASVFPLPSPVTLGNRQAADRSINGYIQRAAFSPSMGKFDALTV